MKKMILATGFIMMMFGMQMAQASAQCYTQCYGQGHIGDYCETNCF